jgi:hypothetical protein
MICSNIAEFFGLTMAWFVWSLFEFWLGKNKNFQSNSTWELLINFVLGRPL